MYFYDWTMILLIPAMLLSLYAQYKVKSAFSRYSGVRSAQNMKAEDVARDILMRTEVDVPVERVRGTLTDHYDPKNKVLRLSEAVYGQTSIAAIAVAAHECGHAVQDARDYFPLKLRNAIVPVSSIGSNLSIPLVLAGLIFSFPALVNIGIILYSAAVFFTVVTLPVEFDASYMALRILKKRSYLSQDELTGAKKVLDAAALTYVAATLAALMNLLRLILISRRR
ncbi:MAG TPA: zinc metallopeptidase [Firmicutes bacterium]|nr:zinc metallopeptidase [Bacillota bacterium]